MVAPYPRVQTAGLLGMPQQQPGLLGGYGNTLAQLMSGIGGALGNYGAPGGLAAGYAQGANAELTRQMAYNDRKRQDRRDTLEEQKLQAEIEERQRKEQQAAQAQQAWQSLFPSGGGVTTAGPGGQPSGNSGLLSNVPPDVMRFAQMLGPDQGMPILGDFLKPQEAPKTTDDMQEYEFAKSQGYGGSFLDWQLERARAGRSVSNTNINMPNAPEFGDIPAGYMMSQGQDGNWSMVPVPGSPAADKIAQGQVADAAAAENTARTGDIVSEDIKRALSEVEGAFLPATGFLSDKVAQVGGTAAHNVKALVDTVRSNIGFDKLQAMRNASPTGGALGQVTERELAFLQSTLGNLDQSQSREQFEYNLKRVFNVYQDIVHGPNGGGPRFELSGSGPAPKQPASPSVPAVGTVEGGFRFKGGDPANKENWEKVN